MPTATRQQVQLIDPISQQEIPGSEAVFSCTMEYVNNSGGSFSIQDITYLPNESGDDCHAKYDYDGTIFIPNMDVTTVIVLPWNNIIRGPVDTYAVTLKQLMLNPSYYHLESAIIISHSLTPSKQTPLHFQALRTVRRNPIYTSPSIITRQPPYIASWLTAVHLFKTEMRSRGRFRM